MTDRLAHALLDSTAADPSALERLRELVGAASRQGPSAGSREPSREHLGCRPQRIYNLVTACEIPHHKDGSRLRFRLSELDLWLEGRVGATAGETSRAKRRSLADRR